MSLRQQGFTLLEILIAIAIFGMVIGLAYSSFNATFHIITAAEEQAEAYSKAKLAMERIINDLESFYLGEEPIFKGKSSSIGDHRADSLEFTSIAPVQLHPDEVSMGHVIIRYSVKEDPESGSLKLYRSEQQATFADEDDPDLPLFLLCDNLEEVAFDYRDKEDLDMKDWGNETDTSPTSLPTLITISLRFNDGEEDELGTLFQTSLILPVAEQEK